MQGSSRPQTIGVATGNKAKFREIQRLLSEYGLKAEIAGAAKEEIQHDDIRMIAERALKVALKDHLDPLLVEDSGLFVESLKGFPGVYSSFVFRTIEVGGLLKLMSGVKKRKAVFRSVVAYGEKPRSIRLFDGLVEGCITEIPRGEGGFGFDPVFVPDGSSRTFAEMSPEEKNMVSHRATAVKKFADWYIRHP